MLAGFLGAGTTTLLEHLLCTIAVLRRTDPAAVGLLVPYLAWTLFASALNASVIDPGA